MMNRPLYLVSTDSGNNNLAPSVIDAETDIEAMRTWLIARGTRSINTLDAYKREAVRFLTWLNENQITMRAMTIADVHRYMDHLRSPPTHWLRPKKTKRGTKLRPTQLMSGPLSERSVAYARTVLTQLFSYLHDAGYLPRNPVKLSNRPAVIIQSEQHRFLDVESWEWLWHWVCSIQGKNREQVAWSARARWLLALLYHTGIRRSEAASAVMSDFVRNDQFWTLRVIGKGLKERNITVNSALLEELRIYRLHRGCQTALP